MITPLVIDHPAQVINHHWHTDGSRRELVTARRVVAKVVPDAVYAGMWRIDLGDGALSGMVDLSRAKRPR